MDESTFRLHVCITISCVLFLLAISSFSSALSQATGQVIVVDFSIPVDPGSSSLMTRAVNQARAEGASAIVIQMNTPGGLLSDMTSIVTSVSQANVSGIPTYTFVPPNSLAASAGSYIAMATNKIAMGPGSIIGPSSAIVIGGTPLEQNHTEAAVLKLMVSLANKWHRNATAAYNMVYYDEAYSADEAIHYHLVEGSAANLADALTQFGLQGKTITVVGENLYEQFLSAVSNPLLDGILILLGVLAIALDIYHPTIFLTIVGVIAIVAGLIGSEVIGASTLGFIILIIAGALIFLELKLGHGFAIMSGMILGAIGVYLLAQGINYSSPSPITSLAEVGLFALGAICVLVGLYIRWIIGPLRRKRSVVGPESLIEKTGVVTTSLTPEGEVRVEGIIWHARSISGNIAAGESVKVKSIERLTLIVYKDVENKSELKKLKN